MIEEEWVRLNITDPYVNPFTRPEQYTKGLTHHIFNRYPDIVPYDETLVPTVPTYSNPLGYINASFITYRELKFIAAQEPMATTLCDFWNMLKLHNIRYVVCLVSTPSYTPYLTINRSDDINENISVKNVTCENGHTFDLIIFSGWPDRKLPTSVDDFKNLVKLVSQRQGLGVIHCSAGVGRSGSLISAVIKTIHPEDSLISVVSSLRRQRPAMVQTIEQYRFVSHFTDILSKA